MSDPRGSPTPPPVKPGPLGMLLLGVLALGMILVVFEGGTALGHWLAGSPPKPAQAPQVTNEDK